MVILLDMDGPVSDLHTEWLRRYNADYEDNLTVDKVVTWDIHPFVKPQCGTRIYDYLREPNLYDGVKPVEGAKDAIAALRGMGNEVLFVTSGVLGNLDQKLNWLKVHEFVAPGTRDQKGVIFAYDKQHIRGQMLIDDGPHNIEGFPGLSVVWDAPYNQNIKKKHYRIKGWADMPALWEKLYG